MTDIQIINNRTVVANRKVDSYCTILRDIKIVADVGIVAHIQVFTDAGTSGEGEEGSEDGGDAEGEGTDAAAGNENDAAGAAAANPEEPAELAPIVDKNDVANNKSGLISIFFISFIAGLLAILTPCVFPMVPLTVTFFTKQSKTKAEGTP